MTVNTNGRGMFVRPEAPCWTRRKIAVCATVLAFAACAGLFAGSQVAKRSMVNPEALSLEESVARWWELRSQNGNSSGDATTLAVTITTRVERGIAELDRMTSAASDSERENLRRLVRRVCEKAQEAADRHKETNNK